MDADTDEERARQAQAKAMRTASVEMARELAATEERLAATFTRMAEQRPLSGEHLRVLSEAARSHASRWWHWAEGHS